MEAIKRITDAMKPGLDAIHVARGDVVAIAEAIPADKRSGVVCTLLKGCLPFDEEAAKVWNPDKKVVIRTDDLKTLIYEASAVLNPGGFKKADKPEA